jgi:putative sterol carrier protein
MPDAKTDFTQNIPQRLANNEDKAKAVNAVFLFKITGDEGGTWTVNCKDDVGVQEGDQGNADCTIETSAADWKTISDNPSSGMQLYFQGKLKVSGNAMLATKLQDILKD